MTASDPDRLPALSARLASLENEPVAAHPDALEEVHRGLVEELDALAVVSAKTWSANGAVSAKTWSANGAVSAKTWSANGAVSAKTLADSSDVSGASTRG